MLRLIFLLISFSLAQFASGQILSERYQETIFEARSQNIDQLIGQTEMGSQSAENTLLLAELYFLKGRNDKALEFLKKLENSDEIKNHPKPELYARWLKNYGLLLWNQGKIDRALEFLQQSLAVFQAIEGLKEENIADLLNNIGLVYVKNEPETALDFYLQALQIYASSNSENLDKIIQLSINISLVEIERGNYIDALKILNEALSKWRLNHQGGLPTEGFIKANIGGVYLKQGQLVLVEDYLIEAKNIYLQNYGERNSELANIYGQLAELELSKQSYKKSLDYLQMALKANSFDFDETDFIYNPKISDINKPNIQLSLLMRKANVLESYYYGYSLKNSHLKIGLSAIDEAESVLKSIRAGTTNKKDLLELSDLATELYEDGQRIALQLHEMTLFGDDYLRKAFQYAEQAKSSLLKTAVVESEAQSFAGIPEEVLEKEKEFSTDLAYLNTQISLESETSRLNMLRDQYFQLKQEYEGFILELENSYLGYYNLKHKESTVDIQRIQESLKQDEAILQYSVALKSDQIYLYIVTNKQISFQRIYEANEILKYLRAYRNTLIYNLEESLVVVASKLYQYLFPFRLDNDISTLVIVPDGELATIPFEALVKNEPKGSRLHEKEYLIESFDIHYAYAASLYRPIKVKEYGGNALFIAPVEFGTEIPALPATELEGKYFKSWCEQREMSVTSLMKAGATKEVFKNSPLSSYRFIHLATHGTVDLNLPDLSGVYFKSKLVNSDILYVGEIYGLSLNAELVVLSACETGLGKINRGEGVMGLGQAFAYSGADNLILSLWKVGDESTSILMQSFYQKELGEGSNSFSEGLRSAKIAMINSEYSAPYYWAPFILWGR